MTHVKDAHESRPNPLKAAETVRGLKDCWRELDGELTRKGGPSSSSGSSEQGAPLDLSVLDAKREIDSFALNYCQMLVNDTTWSPPRDVSTPNLLESLAMRIGHFTNHENSLVAWDFSEELDELARKSWPIARPQGLAWITLPVKCYEEGCEGDLRVKINRDEPLDEHSLALWSPMAVCKVNPEHEINAKILAHSVMDAAASAM